MAELIKKDPKLFGYLKGRWVVRDIARALRSEVLKLARALCIECFTS